MAREDECVARANDAAERYEVLVAMLDDARANHARIPRPFDEYLRQNDVSHINAQKRHDGKDHNLAREGEHNIDDAHDDFIHPTSEITSAKTHKSTQANRAEHRKRCKAERRTNTVQHAREDAAAELIRSEWVLPAEAGEFIRDVVRIRIVWTDPRS